MDRGLNKIIVVTRKTRLDELVKKYNTLEQAKFYIEHLGADFSDYMNEHIMYWEEVKTVKKVCEMRARMQVVDREYLPNLILGAEDIIVVLGQDGLVANTLKYTNGQPVIGINPDPSRWDGVLLPFSPQQTFFAIDKVLRKEYDAKNVTMAEAKLTNGERIIAVNDLFVGRKTHASARYSIMIEGKQDNQSSSGIIVSTGLGSTGWYKSIVTGARRINGSVESDIRGLDWSDEKLFYNVREPYPSNSTDTNIVFGEIDNRQEIRILSQMPEEGVIFSDGMEYDAVEFTAGMEAVIRVADKKGKLVLNT